MPETLQITTPLPGPVAANCNCAPSFTCAELGVTLIGEEEAATIVAVALENLLGAATETAVIVTLGEAGTFVGAEYRPEAEIDPHPEPEQPFPATDHFTDAFVTPETFAENCCWPPTLTCAVNGDTETDTDVAASISIVADADFVGAATEVAVTITCAGLGIMAGAV
jgi:hypothetical protein